MQISTEATASRCRTARRWKSTSPASGLVRRWAAFSPRSREAWSENPADPAFESRVAPGMPLAGALLRARRRHRRRRQRRCHPRQRDSRQLSRSESRRNSHGRRRHAGTRALSARSPSAPAGARDLCAAAIRLAATVRAAARRQGLTPSNSPGRRPSSTSMAASCSPSASSTSGWARN